MNIHGCAIVLGNKGILLRGPSGSGKSRTSDALIGAWKLIGTHACWVGDDRVVLRIAGSKIVAETPSTLQGLAETRFCGLELVDFQRCAVIDLVVDLVEPHTLDRLPQTSKISLFEHGPALEYMTVAQNLPEQSAALITKRLSGKFLVV